MSTKFSMSRRPAAAAAFSALLFLAAAPSAQAAAGAEARIQGLVFDLVDLAPADGVAPSFSLLNDPDVNRLRTELTVNVANSVLGTSDGAISAAFDFIAPLSLDRAVVGNDAHAETTASSAVATALSQARGSASAFASAESNLLFAGDFGVQLSPMTRLTIGADAIVSAFDFGVAGAEGFAFEFAQATSFLRVRGADPGDGSGPQDSFSSRTAATTVDAVADAVDDSGALSVTFVNLSAAPLFAYVSVRSTAAAYGVSAIPEPSTWLQWLAGAGLLLGLRGRGGVSRT